VNSVAFVFPGQGSQSPGMLSDFHERDSVFRETLVEASDALGEDLWSMIESGGSDVLSLTANTQPVLLACSVAIWRSYCSRSEFRPSLMAGHSLGEFSALTAAGVLSLADAVKLVRRRGELMQQAVPAGVGAMAAVIGLDDAPIEEICREVSAETGRVVEAVNFNAPGQVVIAGHKEGVAAAEAPLKAAGAKRLMPLPVSAPFHTSLMRPAAEALGESLANIAMHAPQIPVVHNVTADTELNPEAIRALLVEQLYSPVRWTQCVQAMAGKNAERLVECGPGKVLSGLAKRIDKALVTVSFSELASLETYIQEA